MWFRVLFTFIIVMAVSYLKAADTITLGKLTNPAANQLKGEGTYTVDPANQFVEINFLSKNTKTSQESSILANSAGGNWDGTQSLVAGNYDGWGVILTVNVKTKTANFKASNKINLDVK